MLQIYPNYTAAGELLLNYIHINLHDDKLDKLTHQVAEILAEAAQKPFDLSNRFVTRTSSTSSDCESLVRRSGRPYQSSHNADKRFLFLPVMARGISSYPF